MRLLDEIQHAESEGEKRIAEARHDADELIGSAREEAQAIIRSTEEKCKKSALQMMADAESAAQERSRKAEIENQKVIESMEAMILTGQSRQRKLMLKKSHEKAIQNRKLCPEMICTMKVACDIFSSSQVIITSRYRGVFSERLNIP